MKPIRCSLPHSVDLLTQEESDEDGDADAVVEASNPNMPEPEASSAPEPDAKGGNAGESDGGSFTSSSEESQSDASQDKVDDDDDVTSSSEESQQEQDEAPEREISQQFNKESQLSTAGKERSPTPVMLSAPFHPLSAQAAQQTVVFVHRGLQSIISRAASPI